MFLSCLSLIYLLEQLKSSYLFIFSIPLHFVQVCAMEEILEKVTFALKVP